MSLQSTVALTALAVCWLYPQVAHAGRIQLHSEVACSEGSDRVHCRVQVNHQGDEVARFGTLQAETIKQVVAAGSWTALDPGKTTAFVFELPLPETPGRYPLILWITYEDAEGYPFGVVGHGYYNVTGAAPPVANSWRVKLPRRTIRPGRSASLMLTVEASSSPATAELRWLIPRNLFIDPAERRRQIHPKSHELQSFSAEVENFSAFPTSKFRIYALLSWQEEGIQQSLFVPSDVVLEPFESPTARFRGATLGLMGLLLGGAVTTFRRRPPAAPPTLGPPTQRSRSHR